MTSPRALSRSLVLGAAILLVTPAPSALQVSAADWTPKAPPSIYDPNAGPNAVRRTDYITDVCTTADQLDCVESIAAKLNGAWVAGTSTVDLDGPARLWEIPGVVNLNGSSRVSVTHKINYTGNLFLQTQINAAPVPGRGTGDRDENSLPRDIAFRAVVRTSWVLPTHVSGKSTETKIAVEKLAVSGASRVTLEGIPTTNMIVTDQTTLTSPTGKGEWDARVLSMTVSDGRFYPIKKDCIEKPTIMTSENGYGHPVPTYANGSLDLKVQSPHFRSDGVTKHIGVYEALIPLETAKCLWGDSITAATSFSVEVIETDGSTKTATTSVNVTAEAVEIKASGFTYSTPTIRVKAATSTTGTTPATSTKPAKPTRVRTAGGKGTATVSFARVKGVSYSAVGVKGKSRKTLRCTSSATRVTCKASKLGKGRWKITVTPRNGSTRGTSYSTTLTVR